jgi:hypothetical protein
MLLNMRPSLPLTYRANGVSRYAKQGGYFGVTHPFVRVCLSNTPNIALGEFGDRVFGSNIERVSPGKSQTTITTKSLPLPSLAIPVVVVVFSRSFKNMFGIAARRVVAFMESARFGPPSVSKEEGYAMGVHHSPVYLYLPMTKVASACHPGPTRIWATTLVNFFIHSLLQRPVVSTHDDFPPGVVYHGGCI